ncbi:MAG: replication initiator [Acidimicrobiales bacterium]
MTEIAELRGLMNEVRRAGLCSHPIQLNGASVSRTTGELYTGRFSVACKDRRAVVCPACSKLYKADAWQLAVAGLRGGKGVADTVATHPRLFATLTAPGFGPVHSRPHVGEAPCRARRGSTECAHGCRTACMVRHRVDDPVLGEPLCQRCFDYRGAVLWNAHVPKLWQRTSTVTVRALAAGHGMNEKAFREVGRLSFLKVAEFQRRGLVHLYVVLRADGPSGPSDPPPGWLDVEVLAGALTEAVGRTTVAVAGDRGRAGWGDQFDIRALEVAGRANGDGVTDDDGQRIAAYIAKYTVKTSDGAGVLAHPVRSVTMIDHLGLREHPRLLVRFAWDLGGEAALSDLRLRAHAHTFGFPGHLTTKSIRYSTTFGALRQARSVRAGNDSGWDPVGVGWRFLGRGYLHRSATTLAEVLLEAEKGLPRRFPTPSPFPSPSVPHRADQG